MGALGEHVALLPVVSLPEGASEAQVQEVTTTVRGILQEPEAYVEDLEPIRMHK
jgi:hypothetical protein